MANKNHPADADRERKGKGFFRRWRKGAPKEAACAITLLPRLICCMEQNLYVNLPREFECLRNTKTECIFRHRQNGLRLCISVMQSDLPIHKLTAHELCAALAKRLIPSFQQDADALQVHEYIRGFAKHSPTLQICYTIGRGFRAEDHALYLLQWDHKLYAAAFSGINKNNARLISPICASISLKHHHPEYEK